MEQAKQQHRFVFAQMGLAPQVYVFQYPPWVS